MCVRSRMLTIWQARPCLDGKSSFSWVPAPWFSACCCLEPSAAADVVGLLLLFPGMLILLAGGIAFCAKQDPKQVLLVGAVTSGVFADCNSCTWFASALRGQCPWLDRPMVFLHLDPSLCTRPGIRPGGSRPHLPAKASRPVIIYY
jgi:hypothetical protein